MAGVRTSRPNFSALCGRTKYQQWTAEAPGVALTDVYNTIQAFTGGWFVNYFNDFGRTWQVYVEAEVPYRANTRNFGRREASLPAPHDDGACFHSSLITA